jgi:LysM repeat protein
MEEPGANIAKLNNEISDLASEDRRVEGLIMGEMAKEEDKEEQSKKKTQDFVNEYKKDNPQKDKDAKESIERLQRETRLTTEPNNTEKKEVSAKRLREYIANRRKLAFGSLQKMPGKSLEMAQSVGEWYNKLPTKVKLGIGIGFLAAGGVGMAGAVGGAAIAWRGVAAAGTFVSLKEALTHAAEKNAKGKGLELTKNQKRWHTSLALAAAALVASGVPGSIVGDMVNEVRDHLYDYAHSMLQDAGHINNQTTSAIHQTPAPQSAPSTPATTEVQIEPSHDVYKEAKDIRTEEILRGMEKPVDVSAISSAAPEAVEASGEALEKYTVKKGDSLWKILKENVDLSEYPTQGDKNRAIAVMIDEMRADPTKFGITSGDLDKIKPGDTIRLDLLEGKDMGEITQPAPQMSSGNPAPSLDTTSSTTNLPNSTEELRENNISYAKTGKIPELDATKVDHAFDLLNHKPVPSGTFDQEMLKTLANTREQYTDFLDEHFGKRGGFFTAAISGLDSDEWKSMQQMNAQGVLGMDERQAPSYKMQGIIKAVQSLGEYADPRPDETLEKYVERAFLAKGGIMVNV